MVSCFQRVRGWLCACGTASSRTGYGAVHRLTPAATALAVLTLAGCATAPKTPDIRYTGDPVIDGNAQLAAARPQDRVLWDYRIAAAALRAGNIAEARAKLDDAILHMGGLINNSADAARARSLFSGENAKLFIGEPYERAMAYYYRALLYWGDGEVDNARACYRTAQLIDSDAESAGYRSDYVLFDYLEGLASVKLGADGTDPFKRAVADAQARALPPPPPYDREANVLLFAEFGQGPRKYAGGEYGEQLRFMTADSRAHSAALTIAGRTVALPAYDDLNFQATTRGGRVMDYILGHKAVFKSTTSTVGDAALIGSVIAADRSYNRDGSRSRGSEQTALALGAIGLISKIASAATTPNADTRTWENLPQRLSFAALRLAPGSYPATLEFFDATGQRLAGLTQTMSVVVDDGSKDTVVFLSELKR